LNHALRDPGSYRDPSGFVFRRDGVLYRQVNRSFAAEWRTFLDSGLYGELTGRGLLVPHEPAPTELALTDAAETTIRPREIRYISYPYEWTFTQLQDAALLTLEIQDRALTRGQTLRDATPFNVQFEGSSPIWIDSLSFAPLDAHRPWPAYRQFCEGFLAPLALMAYRDPRLGLLLRDIVDGIPLELASRLLPWRTRLQPRLAAHVHLHAAAQRRATGTASGTKRHGPSMSVARHRALVSHLRGAIASLRLAHRGVWSDYTTTTSYSESAARSKAAIVRQFLANAKGRDLLDIGANDGTFSMAAADRGLDVVAIDSDWAAVDSVYRRLKAQRISGVLPLVADIVNPSPAVGWAGSERRSLLDRMRVDTVMALAVVHHIAISRNVPLSMVFEVFGRLARELIIEWVPKEDPMVGRLLAGRDDVFSEYSIEHLRAAATNTGFVVNHEAQIEDSSRVLLMMTRDA